MSDWHGALVEVLLGPPGHGGFCVARHDGRVMFVRHGLPGERVLARVTEDTGGAFCRADAVEIIDPSADRVPASCPVSGPGGAGCCDFSHVAPAARRKLLTAVVAEQLHRIAGITRDISVEPIGAADDETGGWRTRVRLPVDARGRAGVHRYRSAEVLADLRCPQPVAGAMDGVGSRLWTPGADLVITVDSAGTRHIVELAPAQGTDPGAGRKRGRGSNQPTGPRAGRHSDAALRRRRTTARRAAASGARTESVCAGSGRAIEYVAGRRWELSATGFWQAHRGAAPRYSDLVAQWAAPSPGATAWDLYSGVGVFAARLAEQVGVSGAVHAVESARTAVADGAAALHDLPWLTMHNNRVQRWVAEHAEPGSSPEVVVLDPPRAGAGKAGVAAITGARPQRIVHIGCDPAAFARDVSLYRAAGYDLADLRAFDAFPNTHHVECLALLQR